MMSRFPVFLLPAMVSSPSSSTDFAPAPYYIRRLQNLTGGRQSGVWLGVISFSESLFLPLPTDFVLVPLCLAHPERAWRFALIASLTSLAGGFVAYLAGIWLMESLGSRIIEFYAMHTQMEGFAASYQNYGGWAVFLAAFTPIPYKIAALASGALALSLPVFLAASLAGRALRFFALAGLCRILGNSAANWFLSTERKSWQLSLIIAVVLLMGLGFWLVAG